MPSVLYLLAACNLVIGTGAFGLTGILPAVADSLGVSVAAVGQSMTVYAFATALLAPVLLLASGRWSRRAAMQGALVLFALGLTACALAPSLEILLLGRILMGAGAVLTPIAASIAVAVVEPSRQGQALSLTFLGMSLSYVIGLPLGAWTGLKFGWRVPMAGSALLALTMLALVSWKVPRHIETAGARLAGLGGTLRRSEVVRPLVLTLLYFSAIFTVFAYSGPVLLALNPMGADKLSFTLMVFGLAGVAGTISGGWAADRFGAVPTLRAQLALLLAMMLLVPLTRGSYPFMMLVFVTWGVAGFGMMSPTQARLAVASPQQAPMLFSLNASMLYFGTALGSAAGGAASGLLGFGRLAWVGALFALLGLATFVGGGAKRPH